MDSNKPTPHRLVRDEAEEGSEELVACETQRGRAPEKTATELDITQCSRCHTMKHELICARCEKTAVTTALDEIGLEEREIPASGARAQFDCDVQEIQEKIATAKAKYGGDIDKEGNV